MIRLALRRLLLLAAWSAALLLLTRPLIRNTDNVTIHNKHEDAQVMDKLDQGRLNKSTFQSQLICARYCFIWWNFICASIWSLQPKLNFFIVNLTTYLFVLNVVWYPQQFSRPTLLPSSALDQDQPQNMKPTEGEPLEMSRSCGCMPELGWDPCSRRVAEGPRLYRDCTGYDTASTHRDILVTRSAGRAGGR